MKEPLVSVVIPFYSGIKWLEEALESVEKQTYNNIEILLINDGSEEDLTYLREKYFGIVVFVDKKNGGPATARNKGIELANGKYIAFLDSDDIWLPEKLEKQISIMENNNSVWSQHSYEMFWENNIKKKIINTRNFKGDVFLNCFISLKIQTSCIVVLKETIMENNILFPVDKRYGQDGYFYKAIAEKYELDYVEGMLSKFRIRGNNAGFQAKIQLNSKAALWKEEIRGNKRLRKVLPKSIVFAYWLSDLLNKIPQVLEFKVTNNKKILEIISKILYLIPYLVFRINAIILNE